jgi:hypothetical protein
LNAHKLAEELAPKKGKQGRQERQER